MRWLRIADITASNREHWKTRWIGPSRTRKQRSVGSHRLLAFTEWTHVRFGSIVAVAGMATTDQRYASNKGSVMIDRHGKFVLRIR